MEPAEHALSTPFQPGEYRATCQNALEHSITTSQRYHKYMPLRLPSTCNWNHWVYEECDNDDDSDDRDYDGDDYGCDGMMMMSDDKSLEGVSTSS